MNFQLFFAYTIVIFVLGYESAGRESLQDPFVRWWFSTEKWWACLWNRKLWISKAPIQREAEWLTGWKNFLTLGIKFIRFNTGILKDSKLKLLWQAEQGGQDLTFLKACVSKTNFFFQISQFIVVFPGFDENKQDSDIKYLVSMRNNKLSLEQQMLFLQMRKVHFNSLLLNRLLASLAGYQEN